MTHLGGSPVCSLHPSDTGVCVCRKLRPFDLVTRSLNDSDDGRAAMLLIDAAGLAIQVEILDLKQKMLCSDIS